MRRRPAATAGDVDSASTMRRRSESAMSPRSVLGLALMSLEPPQAAKCGVQLVTTDPVRGDDPGHVGGDRGEKGGPVELALTEPGLVVVAGPVRTVLEVDRENTGPQGSERGEDVDTANGGPVRVELHADVRCHVVHQRDQTRAPIRSGSEIVVVVVEGDAHARWHGLGSAVEVGGYPLDAVVLLPSIGGEGRMDDHGNPGRRGRLHGGA